MSTSPGRAPAPPGVAHAPAPSPRKKAAVSIFNPKKKPGRKPLAPTTHTSAGQIAPNGTLPPPLPPLPRATPAPPTPEDDPSTYQEFPIMIEKSALMHGLHYHGFRMQSRMDDRGKLAQVDPFNEADFTRPVRLYRRRPQDKPEMADQFAAVPGEDDKEREAREIKRAERQAEREANQALIAPTGEPGKKTQKKKPQKKVEDVYYDESNPKFQARSKLRYEEARPWYLEDFDNKNRWVGSYEEPLSKKHVMFEVSSSGFNLVPVEKWYRMVRTDKVKAVDDRLIEKMMDSKHKAPRWFRSDKELEAAAKKEAIAAKREQYSQMRGVKREMDDDDAPANARQDDEYRADIDEIDFEFNDEFQDDDEGRMFGDQDPDDEKELERRIREEFREANLPDSGMKNADDQDWVNEEKVARDAADEERRKQKKIKKKLKKREGRVEYDSDDEDGNIYMDSSDDDDSDEEHEREEEERKKKEEAEKAAQTNGDKSGTSSMGSSTPVGRPEKKALKRDAGGSDLSGNESSRKKAKLNGSAPVGLNGARQLTADAAKRIPSGYGSGSDTDTSRAGRSKLKPLPKNSPPGSPTERNTPLGSRRGSPTGSRAQSPARPAQPGFPNLEEVKAAIPKEGVAVGDLVKMFKHRLAGRTADFIAVVKQAGRQDPASKKIVPKD
ncbi:transcription factor IIF subunit tfg1 [Teratosphaeriaceae sp. CCFEE 6253]|nr:transcription factor IIF subunit tfg1 [Teratosphaeriaceae sp. CCFEE 6253]